MREGWAGGWMRGDLGGAAWQGDVGAVRTGKGTAERQGEGGCGGARES